MGADSYLAFDFGLARIGVAGGERITASAHALTTLAAQQGAPDWAAVEALIEEWRPAALIVGVPRHTDGSDSESTRAAERFARRLAGRFALPVHTVDEALSSHEAGERLAATGRPVRHRRDKSRLDAVSAAVILETWFSEQGLR
ncbi:Holliday junction resolvase RuvX [Arhodomonas sp. AD133]|uniref:Holliday junction resolvase RuvX n=1 Tax=Arhodomonas sp. AD133 TaxID=3415009 RepID=UPI003EBA10EB